tara:strand:- start:1738 stop:2088 length:351 start_codon:yes stop_codon:yes gene_type:complete
VTAVGVPLSAPSEEAIDSPAGSEGETDQVVTVPPVVVGVVVFIVVPLVNVKELGLYVIEVGATSLTTIVRVAVSVPAVLVAVTVYEDDEATAVGVPLMVPFPVFKDKPEGSEGEIE